MRHETWKLIRHATGATMEFSRDRELAHKAAELASGNNPEEHYTVERILAGKIETTTHYRGGTIRRIS